MEYSQKKNVIIIFILSLPFLFYISFILIPLQPHIFNGISIVDKNISRIINKPYTKIFEYNGVSTASLVNAPPLAHTSKQLKNPPVVVKAVYVSDYLDGLFTTTQINAVVIDVKGSSGVISYPSQIANIDQLIKNLHEKGIYVIGRIVVFEDPVLAKARPDLAVNTSWVDPASSEAQDYNIKIAKDAISRGFDEINFDYVRFPAAAESGNAKFPKWDGQIPKHLVIKSFFKKLRESLPDAKISVDLFGQAASNTDDMGIGQVWEDALAYFDYVCPIIYSDQNINYEIKSALARNMVQEKIMKMPVALAKIRPRLRDFNPDVTIRAVQEAMGVNFNGYILWKTLLK